MRLLDGRNLRDSRPTPGLGDSFRRWRKWECRGTLAFLNMSTRAPYEAPKIRDLGDLCQITADVHHVTMGVAQAGVSSPMTPGGGGGGGGTTATAGPPPTPDVSDTSPGTEGPIGFADTSPEDAQGGSDTPSTGTVPGDTTGGRLPFTGLPVAMIAAVGGAMSAAGAAIHRSLRRDSE
jgi:hypothetical protein